MSKRSYRLTAAVDDLVKAIYTTIAQNKQKGDLDTFQQHTATMAEACVIRYYQSGPRVEYEDHLFTIVEEYVSCCCKENVQTSWVKDSLRTLIDRIYHWVNTEDKESTDVNKECKSISSEFLYEAFGDKTPPSLVRSASKTMTDHCQGN